MKTCSKCGQEKEYTEFFKRGAKDSEYSDFCRECAKEYSRNFLNNRTELLSKPRNTGLRENIINSHKENFKAVYEYYGNKCSCCGEDEPKFILIERPRIKMRVNDPNLQYKLINMIVRKGFPEGYRALCWNCRNAIDMFGICPHEEKKGEQNG